MDDHSRQPWHARTPEAAFTALRASADGLSDAEAKQRLIQNGRNELRRKPRKSIASMLKEQLTDPMVLILLGAAVLSAVLREWTEAGVISAIVILNAVIGLVQERRAQSSMEALRKMSAPSAKVLRQGEESMVPAAELVLGDVVFLEDGAMVPADLRLTESANLKIQESSLTGESLPVEKEAGALLPENCALGDRRNMAYASSIVTCGRGAGVVTAAGMDTEVGSIAGLLDSQDDMDTPLKRKLNAVGKTLTAAGAAVCVLIFLIGALYHRPLIPQFLVAVSLAISIIPEGLPATATIVMALGVQRMARRSALVRNLPAVETLGGATVICTDKTGTLTLNKMTVTHVAVNGDFSAGKAVGVEDAAKTHPAVYGELLRAGALCNNASPDPDRPGEIIGDPTEGALLALTAAFGLDQETLERQYPRLFEQPFDSERKRMTTVHQVDGRLTAYTKGAAEELLPLCTHILTGQGARPITDRDRADVLNLCFAMSGQALRVLGFAFRQLDAAPGEDDDLEQCLTFIGAAGMMDPPRQEVSASIRTCRDAGIRTVMITGDHRDTALAIAGELGIWREGDAAVTGAQLDGMTDGALEIAVKTASVFARVSPAHKLRIVQALKRNGEVVAMTGDGVNDSPALKAAHIGVAMGITGTDVAKDAADMILLDDSFNTIAYAIREGRRVYRNIQKVIQFLLAGNIAEIVTLFAATVCNFDAPLLAIHILWVNLATATLPALALGIDPADESVMRRPPVRSGTLFERELVGRVVRQGVFTAGMTTLAYWLGVRTGGHEAGQTMAFSVLALSQMLRAFHQRPDAAPFRVRAGERNPLLAASFAASAALMACILFVPPLQAVFRLNWLSLGQWLAVAGLALLTAAQIEAVNWFRRRRAAAARHKQSARSGAEAP